MKKVVKSEPAAGTAGTGELNRLNSNSVFIVPENSQKNNPPQDTPEVNWLIEQEAARVRMEKAKHEGNITALRIAHREFNYASGMHNGTACTNNPYLYDADPDTWGDE